MSTDAWTVVEAKARFGELIDKATCRGPQMITRYGRKAVVVVSAEEWERKERKMKRKTNLAEFFSASPLRGSRAKIRRLAGGLRQVNL